MAPISELLELICHPLSVRPSTCPGHHCCYCGRRCQVLIFLIFIPLNTRTGPQTRFSQREWRGLFLLNAANWLPGWRFIMEVHLHFASGGRKRRQEFIYAKLFFEIESNYLHVRFYVLTAMRGFVIQQAKQHYIPQATSLINFVFIYALNRQLNTNTQTRLI